MARTTPVLEDVCRAFSLGTPEKPWRRVEGGLSNDLWKLDTARGQFAIKRMVAGSEHPDFCRNVEASFAIESRAIRAGVPAPQPVTPDRGDTCLAEIECEDGSHALVRVHEWAEAAHLGHRKQTPDTARQLGAAIALVHGLAIELGARSGGAARIGPEEWNDLGARATTRDAAWSDNYSSLLPVIARLEHRIRTGVGGSLVAGHRDADHKNVILTSAGKLLLVDWDAAGPVRPGQELTAVLLDWSGARSGEPRHDIVAAVLDGYGDREIPELDPSGWIAGQLGWLHYNARRALSDTGPDELRLGEAELRFFFDQLARIERSMEGWLEAWTAATQSRVRSLTAGR